MCLTSHHIRCSNVVIFVSLKKLLILVHHHCVYTVDFCNFVISLYVRVHSKEMCISNIAKTCLLHLTLVHNTMLVVQAS